MRIIGIDPGISNVGWAILEKSTSTIKYIVSGAVKTSAKDDSSVRLFQIFSSLKKIISNYQIDIAALEETFVNKNPKSSLILGYSRGAILACLGSFDMKILEYAPNTIKKTIVGNGKAEKEQVMKMLKLVIPDVSFNSPDEADAIAIAYTGLVSSHSQFKILDK